MSKSWILADYTDFNIQSDGDSHGLDVGVQTEGDSAFNFHVAEEASTEGITKSIGVSGKSHF